MVIPLVVLLWFIQLLVIFTSFFDGENLSLINSHERKRSNFLFQIYVLLGNIDSYDREHIDKLINDSGNDFVNWTAIKNVENGNSEAVTHEKDDSNNWTSSVDWWAN